MHVYDATEERAAGVYDRFVCVTFYMEPMEWNGKHREICDRKQVTVGVFRCPLVGGPRTEISNVRCKAAKAAFN